MQRGSIPFQDELYDGLGVLQIHWNPYGYPPFGLGNLKGIAKFGLHVDELVLYVYWEHVVVHVIGRRWGNHWGLGTMHTLDQDPVEVQNQEPSFDLCARGMLNQGSNHAMLNVLGRQAKGQLCYATSISHTIWAKKPKLYHRLRANCSWMENKRTLETIQGRKEAKFHTWHLRMCNLNIYIYICVHAPTHTHTSTHI